MTRIRLEMDAIRRWLEGQPLPSALNSWLIAVFLSACATATPGAAPTEIPGSIPTPTKENPTIVPATEVAPTPGNLDRDVQISNVLAGLRELKPETIYGFLQAQLKDKNSIIDSIPTALLTEDGTTQLTQEWFNESGEMVLSGLRPGFDSLFNIVDGKGAWGDAGVVTKVNELYYMLQTPSGETKHFFAATSNGFMIAFLNADGELMTASVDGEGIINDSRPAFRSLTELAEQIGGYDADKASNTVSGISFEKDKDGKLTGKVTFTGEMGDATTVAYVDSQELPLVEYTAANIARSLALPDGAYTLVESASGDQLLDASGKVIAQENDNGVFVPVEVAGALDMIGYPHNPQAEGFAFDAVNGDILIRGVFGETVALLDVSQDPDGPLSAWKLEAKAQKIVDAAKALGLPTNVDYDVTTGADGVDVLVQITSAEPLEIARWNAQKNAWEKAEQAVEFIPAPKDRYSFLTLNYKTPESGDDTVPVKDLPHLEDEVKSMLTLPTTEGGTWGMSSETTVVKFAIVLPVSREDQANLGDDFQKHIQIALPPAGQELKLNADGTVDCTECTFLTFDPKSGARNVLQIYPMTGNEFLVSDRHEGVTTFTQPKAEFKFFGNIFRSRNGVDAMFTFLVFDSSLNQATLQAIDAAQNKGGQKILEAEIEDIRAIIIGSNR